MASKKDRERTLFYRRAVWHKQHAQTLEDYLRQAHKTLNSTLSRTFKAGEYEMQCLAVEDREMYGMFFHVASYILGQSASLVPKASELSEENTKEYKPPVGNDFLENDIFFAVCRNDIILLPNKCRENVATVYIEHFLQGVTKDFEIEASTNFDKLNIIRDEGIKSIIFNTCLYSASLDEYKNKTEKLSLLRKLQKQLLVLFSEDRNAEELKDLENLNVKIEVSANGRKGSLEIFESEAERLIEEDGFVIVTKKGNRITHEQMKISRKDSFKPFGQSIYRKNAFDSIQQYIQELKNRGILEK